MILNSKCLLCLVKSGLATNKVPNTRVQMITVTWGGNPSGLTQERYRKKRETKSSAGAVIFYIILREIAC